MPEYTVSTEPISVREYENRKGGGDLVVWRLGLENAQSTAPDGLFELHKRKGSDPPDVGDTIDVERTQQGEFNNVPFTRLFVAYQQDGPRSRVGPDPKFERRPEHPRNEARMIHTSALSAAVPYINQMVAFGFLDVPSSEDEYWKLVSRVATKLARSYDSVLDPPQEQPQEVPADTVGLPV